MPKIFLKPGSPEFADHHVHVEHRRCEMDGCALHGEHKAPKHRGLNEYYYFCVDHVREYNKAWNFFEGMAPEDVEDYTINSLYGDRPTWKYGVNGSFEEMYTKAWQTYHGTDEDPRRSSMGGRNDGGGNGGFAKHSPEFEAMAIMGLEPPVTLAEIKEHYKTLVKKHHPDLNHGCKKSEDLLKSINMAYTILKVAYEQFEQLPTRD